MKLLGSKEQTVWMGRLQFVIPVGITANKKVKVKRKRAISAKVVADSKQSAIDALDKRFPRGSGGAVWHLLSIRNTGKAVGTA